MKGVGWMMLLAGAVVTIVAGGMDTSISSVTNLAKQQARLLAFLAGGTLFLSGIMLLGLAEVRHSIEVRGRALERAVAHLADRSALLSAMSEAEAGQAAEPLLIDSSDNLPPPSDEGAMRFAIMVGGGMLVVVLAILFAR